MGKSRWTERRRWGVTKRYYYYPFTQLSHSALNTGYTGHEDKIPVHYISLYIIFQWQSTFNLQKQNSRDFECTDQRDNKTKWQDMWQILWCVHDERWVRRRVSSLHRTGHDSYLSWIVVSRAEIRCYSGTRAAHSRKSKVFQNGK